MPPKTTNKKFPSFKNKNVLIFGLGVLGRGLKDAIFFCEKEANVTVTDLKQPKNLESSLSKLQKHPIKYTLGEHKEEDILNADLIIRNAAVPLSSPYMQLAKKEKKKIEMDEALFAKYAPCVIIGITGTRGKSTTTALIGKMLKESTKLKGNVYVAGNIEGEATLPLIDKITNKDIAVLELSSWQLQGFGVDKISPHIAVFTNLYQDHLNYYNTMDEYAEDKKNIFKFQKKKDYCVINSRNKWTKAMADEIPSNIIWFSGKDFPQDWETSMIGEHQKENIAAALAVGKILNLDYSEIKNSLCGFAGLEHRLELVKTLNNVRFVNDTTSTTPIAGQKALASFDKPIILIAGGASKKLPMKEFARDIAKKVKTVLLLEGTATQELENEIKKNGGGKIIAGHFSNMQDAVSRAYSLSLPGDVILLSPGCASFGIFNNEFDRGGQFKKIVNSLR